jgi:hypothetical protein
MAVQLHFLPPYLSEGGTRERELDDSKRKAHAARVSYHNRQEKLRRAGPIFLDEGEKS